MIRRDAIKTLSFISACIPGLPKTVISAEMDSWPICLEYLTRVVELLDKIRQNELDNLLEASHNIARTYKNSGNCFCQWETGHSFDGICFKIVTVILIYLQWDILWVLLQLNRKRTISL